MRTSSRTAHGATWGRRLLVALVAMVLGVACVAHPVAAQSPASMTPSALAFGNVEVGTQSAAQSVTFSHAGKSFTIFQLPVAAPFVLAARTCPAGTEPPLPAGQTCTLSFAFAPTTVGATTVTVAIVVLVDRRAVTLNLTLSGQGVVAPKPALAITPALLDFGNVALGSTADLSATITNTGNVALAPAANPIAVSGGQAGDFAVVANTCGPLKPGTSCTVTVRFSPAAEGTRTSTLVAGYQYQPVSIEAVVPPVSVRASARLVGTGTPRPTAGLSLSPPAADYGSRTVGTASAPAGFTARNTGNAAGKITSVTVSGPAAADYTIATNGCTGTTLNPGATCNVTVVFKPGAVGVRSASLGAVMAEGPTASASLSGSGTAVPAPVLVLEPAGNDFGALLVGTRSATATFTARNTGNAPGKVATVAFGGAAPGDYALAGDACTGVTLAPNATCTIGVVFVPTATGSRAATLGATLAEGPSASVLLAGTGTAPGLEVDPPAADLGATFVGRPTLAVTVTVRSTGTAPVTISGYVVDGPQAPEFVTSGGTCAAGTVLAPAQTCTILVVATPTAPGPRAARLLVAAEELQDDAQLQVTGIAAPTLKMVPPVGQAGRVTVAVGQDFPPGATVRVGWAGEPPRDLTADAAGAFRLSVLVMHHATLGERTMQAATTEGSLPTAEATYLVTAPTVRPHGPSVAGATATAQRFVTRG